MPRVILTDVFSELSFEKSVVHVEMDFTFERITFVMLLTSE